MAAETVLVPFGGEVLVGFDGNISGVESMLWVSTSVLGARVGINKGEVAPLELVPTAATEVAVGRAAPGARLAAPDEFSVVANVADVFRLAWRTSSECTLRK